MGQHFPSFDILKKLANALNVDLKDFFEFTHEGKNTKDLRRIISELLKDANEERLRLVVKILRGVLR
jgi:transcriptional regulator with XRE-family HTH domain